MWSGEMELSTMPSTVVLLCSYSSVPYETIDNNTLNPAVVARVRLQSTITICNIYSQGGQALDPQMLEHIQRQLPQSFIMVGDFNAHNILWGSDNTDARGRKVERFIDNQNINIMNNGAPTSILYIILSQQYIS